MPPPFREAEIKSGITHKSDLHRKDAESAIRRRAGATTAGVFGADCEPDLLSRLN
ncbi:MAG: hypothetical protein LBP64_07530 [Tannerella sp.]|nr:hypothetical protein [Tannerella sp.]